MPNSNRPMLPSSISDSTAKRQKLRVCDIANEDRISKLEDSILLHILSFLPTKDSVKTSILCRRWRFAWAAVPVLDLDDLWFRSSLRNKKRRYAQCITSSTNFIYNFLLSRSQPQVRRLRLSLSRPYAVSDVDSWVTAAIQRNVEEIYLSSSEGTFPQIIFNSGALRVLKLRRLEAEQIVPESVSLPNLKVLHIGCRKRLCGASVERLLSGSPTLEKLEIDCGGSDRQHVSILSPSLKSLVMRDYCRDNRYVVAVGAPKLEVLDLRSIGVDFNIVSDSSVVEAAIYITGLRGCDAPATLKIPSCLCRIGNVKVLSLSSHILKASLDYEFVGFDNLTELAVLYCRNDLWVLPRILNRLPSLKVLTLNEPQWHCNHTVTGDPWKEEKIEINCLKYFEFGGFRGSEEEMQIVEYIMQNARVLNEVRLITKSLNKDESAFLQEILSLQSSSESFKIIIS